ncbi:MAG: ChbG/HpnK family deacetylase [Chthoniobacteraceae bacterium]
MKDNSRRLLLTGDDFGRSAAVNAEIELWHRAGALTQASLMVNEPGVSETVAIARRNPELRVGLHLTLCDGCATDGRMMQRSPTLSGLKFAFFPGARAWLRKEITAQFAKFRALGFAPTYWDGHTHLHLHPVVLALTIPIAMEHGFRFTRLVREPDSSGFLPRVFSSLSARAAPKLKAAGIGFADAVFGLSKSGRMDLDEVRRAVACASERLTEIYFHPGAESVLKDPAAVANVVPPTLRH